MATISHFAPAHRRLPMPGFLARTTAAFQAWREERNRRQRLWQELASLSDRDLADLGFGRADFAAIVEGHFRRS